MISTDKLGNVLCAVRWALVAGAATALLAGCGGPASGEPVAGGTKVSLVAYSTPQEAYDDLIAAFRTTGAGEGVGFETSYGPSGDQSRAVAAGLPADVVAFSLAPDVDKLVDPGIVPADWAKTRDHGFVTDSVVVLATRPGNPKHIEGWDDLIRPGVEALTPNPATSGGAKWNLMAAYGAQIAQGKSPQEATAYVKALLEHVPVQDKSGRESLQTFLQGKGDVAITYENEAITAQQAGQKLDYVIPDQTILIQNPAAVTADAGPQATAFLDWLHGGKAQRIFAEHGYRPVRRKLVDPKRFPAPRTLFTIDDLGGWPKVDADFFDPDTGAIAKLEASLGVTSAG